MATDNQFSIPSHVKDKIKKLGYSVDGSMDSYISTWWEWYTGNDDWHEVEYKNAQGNKRSRRRLSLNPAYRAVHEWARLILDRDTEISVETPNANEFLQDYIEQTHFLAKSRELVEKAFAMGTAAWALWFDVGETTQVRINSYDARMVVPLSWDIEDGISECAFVTRVMLEGKQYDQLRTHTVGESGTYVIRTYLFYKEAEVPVEQFGYLDEFDTRCPVKTFGILKPGIGNTVVDLTPYGMSVYGKAVDAMKGVDLTYDAMMQEIELTAPLVFMDDALIDVRDDHGKAVPVPMGSSEDRLYRKTIGQTAHDFYEVYSPDIRTTPIKDAFNTALAMFGDLTGFGQNYFTLDKGSGLKTATEVSADNSALMRNIASHEESIAVGIADIITALLKCCKIHGVDPAIEDDFGNVDVTFEDSILEDTTAEKNMMMAEIAANLVPKWKYLVEFYGYSEEEAKAIIPAEEIIDIGF